MSPWSTTTTPRPASRPAKETWPGSAAWTGWPGEPSRSTPRWPAPHGSSGGSNASTTAGSGRSGHTPTGSGSPGAPSAGVGPSTADTQTQDDDQREPARRRVEAAMRGVHARSVPRRRGPLRLGQVPGRCGETRVRTAGCGRIAGARPAIRRPRAASTSLAGAIRSGLTSHVRRPRRSLPESDSVSWPRSPAGAAPRSRSSDRVGPRVSVRATGTRRPRQLKTNRSGAPGPSWSQGRAHRAARSTQQETSSWQS